MLDVFFKKSSTLGRPKKYIFKNILQFFLPLIQYRCPFFMAELEHDLGRNASRLTGIPPDEWAASPYANARDIGTAVIVSGTGNRPLAENVGKYLVANGEPVTVYEATSAHGDGEVKAQISDNVRGRNLYILNSMYPDPNTKKTETELMVQAGKLAWAEKIRVFTPWMAYLRADRKDESRISIGGAAVPKILEFLGASGLATIDMHQEALMGAIRIPWENLYASAVFQELREFQDLDNTVFAAPDAGALKRAEKYAAEFTPGRQAVVAHKERKGEEVAPIDVDGNVSGKIVFLLDDIIASAKTTVQAAKQFAGRGAAEVYAFATHSQFTGDALERIYLCDELTKVFVTDTIEQRPEVESVKKIQVVSVAEMIAEVVYRMQNNFSVSDGFVFKDTNHVSS